MKRVAIVENGFITNVVLYEDSTQLSQNEILESEALEQGLQWAPLDHHEPDFAAMANALRTENGFVTAFLAASLTDPLAAGSLLSRFDIFSRDGDYSLFLQSMTLVLNALAPEHAAEIGAEFMAIAVRCHMPQQFLEDLQRAFNP